MKSHRDRSTPHDPAANDNLPGTAGKHTLVDPSADGADGAAVASSKRMTLGAGPSSTTTYGAVVQLQDDPDPEQPPAVQPEVGTGEGGNLLDWDGFYGVPMTLPNGKLGNSIREHYEYALLRHLPVQFPEICARYELPSPDDRSAASTGARHTAVQTILGAIRAAAQVQLRAGNRAAAEQIRVKLFTANQYAIVDALQVEGAPRYAETATDTFCNVYAFDVVTAMGGYLPRIWWLPDAVTSIRNGAEVVTQTEYASRGGQYAGQHSPLVTNNATYTVQQSANALMLWMREFGEGFGWVEVDSAQDAQAEANAGQIVIILGRKADPADHGHVSVVLAESEQQHVHPTETVNGAYVPLQAQAGAVNFSYNDGQSAAGTDGRKAWWASPVFGDAGFFVYRGQLTTRNAIAAPDRLGTALPPQPPAPRAE